jgi:hypothetical protein
VLAAVAAFILLMRLVDIFWQIVPSAPDVGPLASHGLDMAGSLLAVVGLGGIWLAYYLWQLGRMPVLPAGAAALLEATHHE